MFVFRNLKFTQTPDYTYLKFLFRGCMKRHHFEEDGVFDWSHYGHATVFTPRHAPAEAAEAAETNEESQSRKNGKIVKANFFPSGGNSSNNNNNINNTSGSSSNNNNNNDLQVPFIPILHQVTS